MGTIANRARSFLLAYHFASTAIWGRTLGKSVLGIHVVLSDGSRPRPEQAFVREVVGKFILTAVFYLGFVWAEFDRENRTWHDYMSGTLVVFRDSLRRY